MLLVFGGLMGYWFGDLGGAPANGGAAGGGKRPVVVSTYNPKDEPAPPKSGWCCETPGGKCVEAPKGGMACLQGKGVLYNFEREGCNKACAVYKK